MSSTGGCGTRARPGWWGGWTASSSTLTGARPGAGAGPVGAGIVAPVDVPNAAQAQTMAVGLLDRLGVLAGQHWTSQVDANGTATACASGMPCPSLVPEV